MPKKRIYSYIMVGTIRIFPRDKKSIWLEIFVICYLTFDNALNYPFQYSQFIIPHI